MDGLLRPDWLTLAMPFAVAAFPVLLLAAENIEEDVRPYEIVAPIVVLWLGVAASLLVFRLILRDVAKAAMVTVALLSAFFVYGLLLALNERTISGVVVFRGLLLVPFVGAATGVSIWLIVTRLRVSRPFFSWLLVLSLLLIVFNTARIGLDRATVAASDLPPEFAAIVEEGRYRTADAPDVYFFLFDGYGRADVLKEYFGFDNSGMIAAMGERGFQIVAESRANYPYTALSLKTTFNMQHIYDLDPDDTRRFLKAHRGVMARNLSFDGTAVGKVARALGYGTYAYNSQSPIDFDARSFTVTGAVFSPFSELLVQVSALEVLHGWMARLWRLGYGPHNFPTHMPNAVSLADDPAPTFAFIYSLPPRPPLIFDRDGSLKPGWREETVRRGNRWIPGDEYVDQIVYVNSVIIDTVDQILARSERDPIIIIQGDHGPGTNRGVSNNSENPSDALLEERTGILNLMHLPESCQADPVAGMTSVNTFRFIFSSCFGIEIGLLPDRTYWSLPEEIEFEQVFFGSDAPAGE